MFVKMLTKTKQIVSVYVYGIITSIGHIDSIWMPGTAFRIGCDWDCTQIDIGRRSPVRVFV